MFLKVASEEILQFKSEEQWRLTQGRWIHKGKYSKALGPHIFQKSQVTYNKNAHNLQHHFGAQFFMLFHMVWFILFRVLGRENHFLLGWSS